jgi:hypothetical protein
MCCFSIQSTGRTDFGIAMLRFVAAQTGCIPSIPEAVKLKAAPFNLDACHSMTPDLNLPERIVEVRK